MEAERIPRSRLRTVNAASHSDTILVTEDGSPATVPDDPIESAACESLRFFKFPRNCHPTIQTQPSTKLTSGESYSI